MAKRLFGIVTDTTGKPEAMIVNSLSKSASAQIAEARGEDGKVIELQAYSVAKTVSISGVTSADNPADCGAMITIGGVNYLIDKADQNESNTAFVDISISAQTADAADLTSIDGTTTATSGGGSGTTTTGEE